MALLGAMAHFFPRNPLVTGLSALVVLGAVSTGCARKHEARAESLETRLTSGDGSKVYPRFSPDGNQIAYSQGPVGKPVIYIVSATGGESKRISPEGVYEYAIDWTEDGKGVYAHLYGEPVLRRIGMDGAPVDSIPLPNLQYLEDARDDGSTFLAFVSRGENYDVGIVGRDGSLDLLTQTPDWELYGAFGPKPEEVTFIRYPTYGAATSEVVVWSPTTRAETPLALPRGRHATPTWSPDGTIMVYCSEVSGNMDLWAYEAATAKAVQLTSTPEEEKSPHWSFDGERVAFSRRSQTSHIFVGDPSTYEKRQLTEGPDLDGSPVVTRDGAWVAFIREARGTEGTIRPAICIASTEAGSEVTPLDLSDLILSAERRPLMWSYDGAQLAFAADDGTGNVDIYRIPREGGMPERVTIEPGMDYQPTWSPDGANIAYVRRAGGETQIWVIPATGGVPRRLPQNPGVNQGPLWAPDSDHLAYYTRNDDMRLELWVTSVEDPKGARRLREAEDAAFPMRWSDDGSQVLVFRKDGERYDLWAVGMDGSLQAKILSEQDVPKGFPVFTEEGKRYFSAVFPGKVHVFADGEDVSDIFVLRVNEALERRAEETAKAGY